MPKELENIISKAEKDHSLDMKKEIQILKNIPESEELFKQTFEKLKKVAGKNLHKIDFKDYLQLSTVILDEKDCIALLKSMTKPQEELVGAAYNLWRSLSGVKWFFEVKKLEEKKEEEIDLKKVVELD